jgi:hypothetical protein
MAQAKTREKTSKAIADTPPLFTQRQEGVQVEHGGVRFLLKGLTWQEEERCGSIQAASVQSTWANHRDSRPELDDFDFQVADVLTLRLGVHDATPLPGCDPATAAAVETAKAARKEMTIGESKRLVFSAAFFEPPFDGRVAKAFLRKIEELTRLSEAEEIKLVFTTPSQGG